MSESDHESVDDIEKGNRSLNAGRFEEAIQFYDHCKASDQNNTVMWKNKAESFLFLGKYRDALDCAEKAINIDSGYIEGISKKGEALNFLGRYKDALDCAETALKKAPNDDYALYIKAYALDYSGKHEEALKYYERAISENHNNADYWIGKGIALNYLRKYLEAIDCFEKSNNISKISKIPQSQSYALINEGESYYRLGKYVNSKTCYEKALKASKEACEINPRDSHSWTFQGISLFRLGWYEKSSRCFDKVTEQINDEFDLAYYLKGYNLDYSGNHEEAIKYYEKAIDLNPNDADYWTSKGATLYDLKDYNKALQCFEKALELDPSYDIAYLKIGECKYQDHKYSEALEYYKKVSDPQYDGVKHNDMGLCHYQLASYKEAEEDYRKAMEFKIIESCYNLGVLFLNKDRDNDAKKMFENCLKMDKNYLDAARAIKKMGTGYQSDWFKWWFSHRNTRKALGLTLMILILGLIVIITAVILHLSIKKGEIAESYIAGLTVLVGLLVLIMLLPSLRKFKVGELEIEVTEIKSVKTNLEPTLPPKLGYKSLSY
jgi:tetratricopeptide (TPR) repeat protein